MGKSKKPKTPVADYRLSIHLGVCYGPVDAVEKVYIGEKEVWAGNQTASGAVSIDKPEVFGGLSKEGGVSGVLRFLFGEDTQVMPENLAAKFNLTTATCPAFRGIFSLFFYNSETDNTGFKWATNSPYIKPVWVKLRRKSPGLNPAKAMIGPDSNPANIVYECLTNTDWGGSYPPTALDTASFQVCQDILFSENFGLSLAWHQPTRLEAFIQDIMSHVNGGVFLNPKTGLITMRLIRGGYSLPSLRLIGPSEAEFKNIQRTSPGETTNEVVVTWTNPDNEQEETLTFQDLASISIQGGIVSDPRNYHGIRNATLASTVGARDIRQSSVPLLSMDAYCDRSAWDVLPTDVVRVTSPEDGITEIAMRVMNVARGKPKSGKIKLTLLEDVFSLGTADYGPPPTSGWEDESQAPEPITDLLALTVPYNWWESLVGDAEAAATEFPEAAMAILAARPNSDTISTYLYGEVLQPNGDVAFSEVASLTHAGTAELLAPMVFEANSSNVVLTNIDGPNLPGPSTILVIGPYLPPTASPDTHVADGYEIAMILSNGTPGFNIRRGLYDTIPREWAAGTKIWFFSEQDTIIDPNVYSAGEVLNFKLLPRTSQSTLPVGTAPTETYTPSARLLQPIRPANVTVGGVGYGTYELPDTHTSVAVTWANRNRKSESAPPLAWNAGTIAVEPGQTTTIRIEDMAGNTEGEHTGLTGTSFVVPLATFGTLARARVRVISVLDGLESFQSHSVVVDIPARMGYGKNYGEFYGE